MKVCLREVLACTAVICVLSDMAGGCGDSKLPATAAGKAQLLIKAVEGSVHIGQKLEASLVLPKDSQLETGILGRTSCTSFQFKVEPNTGWHDPWADWYYSGIPQHASGDDGPWQPTCGVSGEAAIILADGRVIMPPPRPPQITFTLNGWLQFDKPGKYTISVEYRARPKDINHGTNWDEPASAPIEVLKSDPVEVEVLPEPDDVDSRVAAELAWYKSHTAETSGASGSSENHPYPEWATYSQSAAVIPLILRLHEDGSALEQRPLITLQDQQAVVSAMEQEVHSPVSPVSPEFIEVLAFDRTRLQYPDLFGKNIQDQWTPQWIADSKVLNEAFYRNLATYTRELLDAVPQKSGAAQGVSLRAVLHILAHRPVPDKESLRQKAARQSALLLPKMKKPPDLWEDEWRVVASPAMVPFLLLKLQSDSGFEEQYQRWLTQVAPLRARRLMISAMRRGDWNSALDWARVVRPDDQLSLLVNRWVIRSLETDEAEDQEWANREWILLKFGTPAAAKLVRGILADQECFGHPTLWAFLLKVEGARAERSLISRYRNSSETAECRTDNDVFTVVEQLDSTDWRSWKAYWSPGLEGIFLSKLGSRDRFIAGRAAELLGLYGSRRVEDILWAKLEAWHSSPPPQREHEDLPDVERPDYFEDELISALLQGHTWTAHNHIERLRALCVYACWEVDLARPVEEVQRLRISNSWLGPGPYGFSMSGSPVFSMYTLREWLQRFPPGTKFAVMPAPFNFVPLDPADVRDDYPALWHLLREKNFEVVGRAPVFDTYGRCLTRSDVQLAEINSHRKPAASEIDADGGNFVLR